MGALASSSSSRRRSISSPMHEFCGEATARISLYLQAFANARCPAPCSLEPSALCCARTFILVFSATAFSRLQLPPIAEAFDVWAEAIELPLKPQKCVCDFHRLVGSARISSGATILMGTRLSQGYPFSPRRGTSGSTSGSSRARRSGAGSH